MGWMHDEFNKGLPGRAYVQASSRDNPHLPKDYVDSLNLTGRMAEAYIHGGFVSIEGVVYFTYEPREGESLIETAPDPECATYGALDFGRRRPFFMIVQEQVHEGEVVDVIVDEVPGSDILEETHAYQCAKMLVDHKIQMLDVFCDPAGGSTNAQTGISSIAIYEKAFRKANVLVGGMRFTTSRTDRHIPAGVEATRALFQNHAGKRRLFVAKHLTDPDRTTRYPDGVAGVHASLMGYSYPKNKPNEAMPDKKSSAGYDHAMDALRYFVINKYGVMDAPSMLDLNPPPMSHIIGDHAFADPMDHPDNW
tara:strand:- start:67 stop:990 length:924 start_codon:yes stop_codon:yes gene_type:complete